MTTLLIRVDFSDASDFDYYRTKFVAVVEDEVGDAQDPSEGGRADGKIEVTWDVED